MSKTRDSDGDADMTLDNLVRFVVSEERQETYQLVSTHPLGLQVT
jgi:hypothetical protein